MQYREVPHIQHFRCLLQSPSAGSIPIWTPRRTEAFEVASIRLVGITFQNKVERYASARRLRIIEWSQALLDPCTQKRRKRRTKAEQPCPCQRYVDEKVAIHDACVVYIDILNRGELIIARDEEDDVATGGHCGDVGVAWWC